MQPDALVSESHRNGAAPWGRRVAATFLDFLIVLLVGVAIGLVLVGVLAVSETVGVVVAICCGVCYLVLVLCYSAVLMSREGARNGQTYGKRALGIRVLRDSGEPFGFGHALVRELIVKNLVFGSLGGLFLYIPVLLNNLWPLWDKENRALHDMVVSTHVVRV
jgi:uncharacterized RDD family membrane protein YckC